MIFIGIKGTVVALDRSTGTGPVRHHQRRDLLPRSGHRDRPLAESVEGPGPGAHHHRVVRRPADRRHAGEAAARRSRSDGGR